MAERKSTKGQTTIYKTYMINTNPTKNQGWTQVLQKGKKFLLHYWHTNKNKSIA